MVWQMYFKIILKLKQVLIAMILNVCLLWLVFKDQSSMATIVIFDNLMIK